MDDLVIKELLKNFPRQNFGVGEQREANIKDFMMEHPEIFKWFFEKPSGKHSKNLLTSDLQNVYTTMLRFTDLMPGTRIRLVFAEDGEFDNADHEDIIIGATGNYYADEIRPVYGIYFIKDDMNITEYPISPEGTLAYQYKVPIRNSFDSIADIEIDIGANKQFIGPIENLISFLDCTKEQVTKVSMSRYFKRPVEYLFYQGQDLIDFSENAFMPGYINNFKSLVSTYENKLYWDTNYTGTFDEKEHMEYSPFSIYVLRNSYVTANGEKQNIINHIKHSIEETGEANTHVANHMFEKYYIDRYINAQTAEDMLTERMSLAARIAASTDEEEKAILEDALSANPVYVLDPIAGKVYKAGENYIYNPTIIYNNEPIDLREIQRYDLDNLEPTETTITVGNGVYGDIFYQKVTMKYSFEETDDNLSTIKDTYYNELARLKNLRKEGQDPSRAELEKLDEYYNNYNSILAETIKNWTTRETDLEEE